MSGRFLILSLVKTGLWKCFLPGPLTVTSGASESQLQCHVLRRVCGVPGPGGAARRALSQPLCSRLQSPEKVGTVAAPLGSVWKRDHGPPCSGLCGS